MIASLYVNLPVTMAVREPGIVDMVASRGMGAELGLDAAALDEVSPRAHAGVARRLREAGVRVAAHLPFMDLRPGAGDPLVLAASRERLDRGLDRAIEYEAEHMVAHVSYHGLMDGFRREDWLETSVHTWEGLLAGRPGHPPLRLENTYEMSPRAQVELLDRLPGVGACLDLGHWFSFARGREKGNLGDWLKALGPRLAHLHLHDNHGDRDAHLGLGRGAVPFGELFAALGAAGQAPTATLEPHTVEDFDVCAAFMAGHPDWFAPEAS